jgi:hypothetical protein
MPDFDYTDHLPKAGDNILAVISGVALEQKQAELKVARLEEELKAAKEELRVIAEDRLPQLMDDAKQTTLTTTDGIQIEVKTTVRGSIPKTNPGPALEWLEKNGHGNLIKRSFDIVFGKDDEAWAKKFQSDLDKRKKKLNYKIERGVHASTLQAFVRNQLEEGAIDSDAMKVLGVFEQRVSSIDYPEEKPKF